MPFLAANIDRAIVMTQYDLRGFAHPMTFQRLPPKIPKYLTVTTFNLVSFAAGIAGGNSPTDESYIGPHGERTFEEYLSMCRKLADDCDVSQKEAIHLLVEEIVRQSAEMRAEVGKGEREPDSYLKPLSKDNNWGKLVLALKETFSPIFDHVLVA